MKFFKDVADGEHFVLNNGQQLIRVNEGGPHNAVDYLDSSKGFFISDYDECLSVDELMERSVEIQED